MLVSSLENVEETRCQIIFLLYDSVSTPVLGATTWDCWRLTSKNFTFSILYITVQLLLLTPTNARNCIRFALIF